MSVVYFFIFSFLVKHFPDFESTDVVRNFSPQKPAEHLGSPKQIGVREQMQSLQFPGCKVNSEGIKKGTTFHNCSKARTPSRSHRGRPALLLVFFLPKNPADRVMYARNWPLYFRTFHHFTFSIRCL